MTDNSIALKSLNLLNEDQTPCTIESLFTLETAVRTLIVISAYIDVETIDAIVKFLRKNKDRRAYPTLRIYIDYSASNYTTLPDRADGLRRCAARIAKFCSEDSGIYLVRTGNLFHTKCYLIRGNQSQKLIVGSLNATQNGLSKNEELVLVGQSALDSDSYVSHLAVWLTEKYLPRLNAISDVVAEGDEVYHFPTTMRQLLLDGWLYYERREQDPFRFPLRLPEEILEQDASIHPLLPAKLTDGISVMKLIQAPTGAGGLGKGLPRQGSRRHSWKRYCIETCYGYWSPDYFGEELDRVVMERAKSRLPYFKAARDILNKQQLQLARLFESFAQDLNNRIRESYPELSWEAFDDGILVDAWSEWYARLLKKLGNDEQFDRIVSGLTWTTVPDIWNDPIALEELETSFFNSLKYYWSKCYSKRSSCLPAARIAANLDVDNDMDHDRLRRKIELWAKKHRDRSIFSEE
jgi:hypothetical protein